MITLDEARVRRYLLGQLPEDEASALEGEYFANAESLERVWGVENDLVDAYVAGGLRPEDRSAFEDHYLASPLHRDRVESARALRAFTSASADLSAVRRQPVPWARWLALAAGVPLAFAAWWLFATRPPPAGVRAQVSTTTTMPPAEQGRPTAEPATSPTVRKPVVAAFALSPLLRRGGQATPVLRVPRGTDEIAITLEGERPEGVAAAARLPFSVTTVEGARVARGRTEPGTTGFGVARLAADALPAGDYLLAVLPPDGEPDAAPLCQYFFRIPPR